ncbi:MAG: hypothetical protein WCI34_05430, partial [Actinomycetes bacterium]
PDLAAAATRAKSGLGQLSADLAGPTFTPNAIVDENAKIRQLISIAKSHGLKVMARAPSGAI